MQQYFTSPRTLVHLKQKMYTASITVGKDSQIYKDTVVRYNKSKEISCESCAHFNNGTCTFISNFDVVAKKEIYKPLVFFSDICKGYFWTAKITI